MVSEQSSAKYTEAYPALAATLPGLDTPWLQAYRQAGLTAFAEHGFPHLRDEEWRYTNLSALQKNHFIPTASQVVDAAWLESYRLQDAWSVVLVNGRFSADLSRLAGLPEAVKVQSLRQVLQQNPTAVQDLLGQAVGNDEHSLVAFNSAWFGDGVWLELAADYQSPKPLQIIHVVTEPDALAATRQLWLLHDNATVEIVETFIGSTERYFTAAINEVFLRGNAALTLHKVQLEAEQAVHFGGCYLKQNAHSRFIHHNFALGAALARSDIHAALNFAAECTLQGLYLGCQRQHLDNHTRIEHLKPQGISREYYKGVLDQRARGVFQGRVIVAEDAQQTDSQMNNRNLLLSADAEVDTKPQLEIYADDVKCSHGVSVGQLEEKSVFYLQSRGLDEASARNILTFAFANEMVDKVENAELQAMLLKELLVRFPAISL